MAGLKLTDMAQAPEKREKLSGPGVGGPAINPYSYEHRISLDDAALTKLGMSTPKVGDKMLMHAHGEITSVSSHQSNDSKKGKASRNVQFQIHKMGMSSLGGKGGMADAVESGIKQGTAESENGNE